VAGVIRLALALGLLATPLAAQRTGDVLPTAFALGRLDGGRDSLAGARGMVRIVNVWATWCPPCRAELPSLAALADSVRGEPIRVYAVAIDDPDRVRAIAASLPSLPVYLERVRFPKAWGRWAMPTTYVLDGDDRLVLVHHGATKWDDPAVIRQLRALVRNGAANAAD
jgi:thiol-disulfide isomerase/thioredoxin